MRAGGPAGPAESTHGAYRSPQGAHRMLDGPAPVLEVSDLRTVFATRDGAIHAVNGVSFAIAPGELLGVVGESGSGKSVTMMSLMGLLPSPPAEVVGGSILYQGREVRQMSAPELRALRGGGIGFVFQDPMTSLNPVFTVGYQLMEPIRAHLGLSQAGGAGAGGGAAGAGRHPGRDAPARRLSAPVLRRHAPAGDDRDGAVAAIRSSDRRRADHGARRHHPGADPRDRARAAPAGSAWGSSGSPTTSGWWPASPTG